MEDQTGHLCSHVLEHAASLVEASYSDRDLYISGWFLFKLSFSVDFPLKNVSSSASYLRVYWPQEHQHLCTTVLLLPHMESLALLKHTHQLLNQGSFFN